MECPGTAEHRNENEQVLNNGNMDLHENDSKYCFSDSLEEDSQDDIYRTSKDENDVEMVMEFETTNDRIKEEMPAIDDKEIESEIVKTCISYMNATSEMEELQSTASENMSHNFMMMLTKDNEYVKITNGRKENMNTVEKHPFKCSLCGKQFTEFCSLKRHSLVHTKEKPHVCSTCGRPFSRYESLTRHMLIHSGEKPHKCEICGKRFTFPHILNRHLLIHTGDKPYECHICGKQFSLSYHVTRHLLTHTGEKPFNCEFCGKQFSQQGDLKRHMLLHSDENPNTCYVCGKGFTKIKHLEKHIAMHEAEEAALTCEICGRKFTKARSKKMHMNAHVRNAPEPGSVPDEVMQLYTRHKNLMKQSENAGKKDKAAKLKETEDVSKKNLNGADSVNTLQNNQSSDSKDLSFDGHTKNESLLQKNANVDENGKEKEDNSNKNENSDGSYSAVETSETGKYDKIVDVLEEQNCGENHQDISDVGGNVRCCNTCGIYFINTEQFDEHMATIHEDESRIEQEEEEDEGSGDRTSYTAVMSKTDMGLDSSYKYVL